MNFPKREVTFVQMADEVFCHGLGEGGFSSVKKKYFAKLSKPKLSFSLIPSFSHPANPPTRKVFPSLAECCSSANVPITKLPAEKAVPASWWLALSKLVASLSCAELGTA